MIKNLKYINILYNLSYMYSIMLCLYLYCNTKIPEFTHCLKSYTKLHGRVPQKNYTLDTCHLWLVVKEISSW